MADSGQLDIEVQINQALQARAALMESNKSKLADQIALAQELCRAMECESLDGYNDRIQETKKGLLEAADAADKTRDSTDDMDKSIQKNKKSMFSWKGAALGAVMVVKNAFGMLVKTVKMLGGFVKTVLIGGFNIVRGVMQGWTSMLGMLAEKSMEAANAGMVYLEALEDTKETLGALDSGAGKAAIDMFGQLRSSVGDVAGTGIRFNKLFGRGPAGLAAAVKFTTDIVEGLGNGLDKYARAMGEAGDEALVLNKGLGMTGEDLASIAKLSGHMGKTVKEAMGDMITQITEVSSKFAVNSRVMAKNMATMMKMPGIFGANTKEMLKTSVAAQKMGMSIEQLTAATKVFDDFESGATAAAELAAEFGVVVDAMDMMTATPAEQTMMLKEALDASGKSFADMSRQERARLADLATGGDMEQLMAMMDPTNAFDQKAMDGVEEGVDAATQATLDQTKAVKELAKQMKKLHESMEPMNVKGGFFGSFIHGMETGFFRSKQMRESMHAVRRAFQAMFFSGKEVGNMLGELLDPPNGPLYFLYEYFQNLEDRMARVSAILKKHFRTFVDDLTSGTDDATFALKNLVKSLVTDLFGTNDGVFGGLFEGFAGVADLIVANILNLLPYVAEGLIKLFEGAIRMMGGELPDMGVDLGKEGFMPMTQKAFEALKEDETIQQLGSTFMTMMSMFWEKFGKPITDFVSDVLVSIFLAAIVKALPFIIGAAVLKGLGSRAMKALGDAIFGPSGGGQGQPGGATRVLRDGLNNLSGGIKDFIENIGGIDFAKFMKAGLYLGVIGAGIGLGVLGVIELAKKIVQSGLTPTQIGIAGLLVMGVGKTVEYIGNALKVISESNASWKDVGMVLAIMAGASLILAAMIEMIRYQLSEINDMDLKPGLAEKVQGFTDVTQACLLALGGLVAAGMAIGAVAILASIGGPLGAGAAAGIILLAMLGAGVVLSYVVDFMIGVVEDLGKIPITESVRASIGAETLAVAAGAILEVFDRMWGVAKGLSWLNPFNNDIGNFQRVLNAVGDMIDTMVDDFFPKIMKVNDIVTVDPTYLREKLELITSVVRAFEPLFNIYTAAMQIKDVNPQQIMLIMMQLGSGLKNVIGTMGTFVSGIVMAIGDVKKEDIEKANAVGTLISAVASLVGNIKPADLASLKETANRVVENDVMTGLLGTGRQINNETVDGVAGSTTTQNLAQYFSGFSQVLESIVTPLKTLIESIGTIDFSGVSPANLQKKMEAASSVLKVVGDTGEALTSLKYFMQGRAGKAGDINPGQVKKAMADAVELFTGASGDSPGIFESIGVLIEGLRSTPFGDLENATKLADATDAATRSIQSIVGLTRSFSIEEMTQVGPKLVALQASLMTVSGQWQATAVQPLIDVVKAFAKLQTDLAGVGAIDIYGTIMKVGDALGYTVDQGSLTVNSGNVQVKINLNVKLVAEELAKVLVDKEYVQQGAEYESKVLEDASRR